MRDKQRYFAVVDADNNLLPYFITVRNGDAEHIDNVRKGNEHVLRARFADAQFFYNEDIKQPLEDFLPRLGTLTFHEKVGSMLDKNNRVKEIVSPLGDLFGMNETEIAIADQAAGLAKADLATQMVVEMTSLQGIMGREYARFARASPRKSPTPSTSTGCRAPRTTTCPKPSRARCSRLLTVSTR